MNRKRGEGAEPLYVAYYRVSTAGQERSGLGLEAQRAAVCAHLGTVRGQLVGEFTETESGRKRNRPELSAALDACRRGPARLIIARLDRLGRNVAFVSALMESRVEFVAVDNPHASTLHVHIMAAFAQEESRLISERTRAALAAAKVRGVRLGATGEERAREKIAAADAFAMQLAPVILELQEQGITTQAAIAEELNNREIVAPDGGKLWHQPKVSRLLRRIRAIT